MIRNDNILPLTLGHTDRLPLNEGFSRIMQSPIGAVLARPWFDWVTLWFLRRSYFPLSRLWAAAHLAKGDPVRFAAEVPFDDRGFDRARVARWLARFEAYRRKSAAADAAWERAFFGPEECDAAGCLAAEQERLKRRHSFMLSRRLFLMARFRSPRVKWDIVSPASLDAEIEPYLGRPEAFYALPDTSPVVARSRVVAGPLGPEYWVRFVSPVAGDVVHARVFEPEGADATTPTLILGHGIGVEFDHWKRGADEAFAWLRRGVRVIRPEAPGHGRRTRPGQYGGECMLGRAPLSGFELFRAQVIEGGALTGWIRTLGTAAVGVGGYSLSALAAQLIASAARNWPAANRPDALFVVSHSDDLTEITFDGSLSSAFGVTDRLIEAGWTRARLAKYAELAKPGDTLAVPPARIVSVLARHDTVTPFVSGRALVARWGVPAENLFIWPRGHFSAALGLMYDHTPIDRFCEVLDAASPASAGGE